MLIGLTGGIGSGKSTIASELRRLGYPVFDTDSEAKRIIVHNLAVRSQIEMLFGSEVFDGDTYLTDKVAAQVFQDPTLLDRLNHIVHPAVRYELEHWYKSYSEAVCFVECAILYEAGIDQLCDRVVEVTAPEEVRIARVIARDHTTIENVRARIRAQEHPSPITDNPSPITDNPSPITDNPSPITDNPSPIILSNDGITPIPELVKLAISSLI